MSVNYGMFFVNLKSNLYSALVNPVVSEICYTGTRYNGTRLNYNLMGWHKKFNSMVGYLHALTSLSQKEALLNGIKSKHQYTFQEDVWKQCPHLFFPLMHWMWLFCYWFHTSHPLHHMCSYCFYWLIIQLMILQWIKKTAIFYQW